MNEKVAIVTGGSGGIGSAICKAFVNSGSSVSVADLDISAAKTTAKKISKGKFDLEDFAKQLNQMRKMGGIGGVMTMLPGISKAQKMMAENNISNDQIIQFKFLPFFDRDNNYSKP